MSNMINIEAGILQSLGLTFSCTLISVFFFNFQKQVMLVNYMQGDHRVCGWQGEDLDNNNYYFFKFAKAVIKQRDFKSRSSLVNNHPPLFYSF